MGRIIHFLLRKIQMFGTTNQFCMVYSWCSVDYIIIQYTHYVYIYICVVTPPLIYLEAFHMKITMIYVYTYMCMYIYIIHYTHTRF